MTDQEFQNETHLQSLLADMDVPAMRRNDLNWLARNLAVRNENHRNYGEAIRLIHAMRRHPSSYKFFTNN